MVSDGLLASKSLVGQKSGSATEPQVRPPNMGDFRVLVWPPNVAQPVAYKRPQTENGRVFLPILVPRCVHVLPWSISRFPSSSMVFMSFILGFEEF